MAQEKKTPESRKKRKTPESRNKIGHRSSRAWGLKESRNGGSELADHVSIELFRKIDIWHKIVVFQFETCKIYSISTCSLFPLHMQPSSDAKRRKDRFVIFTFQNVLASAGNTSI